MNDFTTIEFPIDDIRFKTLARDEDALAAIREQSPEPCTPEKIKQAYGEVLFPPAPEDRPYTFASIVVSADGKIAFPDDGHGELIAGNNFRDPKGALADFWVLNMLRFYADGVVIGARTLQTNEIMWANCFDAELAELRRSALHKRHYCPSHVVVSFDGTDIPFDHMIFGIDAPLLLATSPEGMAHVQKHSDRPYTVLGPWKRVEDIDVSALDGLLESAPQKRVLIGTGEGNRPDSRVLLFVLKHLGMDRVLIESPSYMTYLMSMQSMDEMFINYSSVFAGGSVGLGGFLEFSVNDHPHSDFIQVNMHQTNFLATRQKLIYGLANPSQINIHTGKPVGEPSA